MEAMSDRLIADAACLDPVYVDGIAGVFNLGENFGMLFFRWVPKCSSSAGAVIYEKSPVLYLVRPQTSLLRPGAIGSYLRGQTQPQREGVGLH